MPAKGPFDSAHETRRVRHFASSIDLLTLRYEGGVQIEMTDNNSSQEAPPLERQKWEAEKTFREREIAIKEREQANQEAELDLKRKEQA